MSTAPNPITFDMSKARPIDSNKPITFDMSKAAPLHPPEDELTRQNREMTAALSGQTTTLSPQEKAQAEAGKEAGFKAAAETTGSLIGTEALAPLKGLIGSLLRIMGSGGGAGLVNAGFQAGTTGNVDTGEALKTAGSFALPAIVSEAPAIRGALRDALFSEGKITNLGKNLLPESMDQAAARKLLGAPELPVKGESVPITKSPNFNPEAYKAGRQARVSATSTETEAGTAFEPGGKIVQPGSAPPATKVTYQSVPGKDLLDKVMSGDRNAIFEWQRRGLPLPANVKFMVEQGPTQPWRNPSQ